MTFADYYDRIINWPSRTALLAALGVAALLLVIAVACLSLGKLRKTARAFGLLAVVAIVAFMWTVREQTVTVRSSAHIAVTTYRQSERSRLSLLLGLVTLPAVAAVVMSSVLVSTRRRLRELVPSRLRAGRRHHAQKKYAAALREYNQAIKTSPNLAEGYFRRGALYQTMGEKTLALADFERAIERDSRFTAAYTQRGKICLESGDFDSALADFGMLMTLRKRPRHALEPRHLFAQEGARARGRRRFSASAQADQPFRLRRAREAIPSRVRIEHCPRASLRRRQWIGGKLGTGRS